LLLQRAYPILFEICPLTMRTEGILLVKDTILLLGVIPADGERYASTSISGSSRHSTFLTPDVKLGLWRQSCDRLLASLEGFSLCLLSNIKRFHELCDNSGAEVISSSCIACLAHLAVLYEAVCRTDPIGSFELRNLCDSTLERLGTLTLEVHFDEYTYLDLLLGVRPSLSCFPISMAQTGDWDRTLGRNRCRSSTPA
jgi:hypothetical protein